MKAFYDNAPLKIEAVGNGSFLYRWNITETTRESIIPDGIEGATVETTTQWQCDEVTVWPPLTANTILKAAIAETWSSDYEQKLVNEYNAAKLGLYDTVLATTKIASYSEFLLARNTLKQAVDTDCLELGIQ